MTTTVIARTIATDTAHEQDAKYPLEEMIKWRYKHDMSIGQIGDKMGCHRTTVFRKLEKFLKLLPNPDEVENYRKNKVTMLTALEAKVYGYMCNNKTLKEASFNNLAYGFSKITLENRLEQGLATERIDSFAVTASLDDLARRKQELVDKVMASVQPVVVDTVSTPSIIPAKQDK